MRAMRGETYVRFGGCPDVCARTRVEMNAVEVPVLNKLSVNVPSVNIAGRADICFDSVTVVKSWSIPIVCRAPHQLGQCVHIQRVMQGKEEEDVVRPAHNYCCVSEFGGGLLLE